MSEYIAETFEHNGLTVKLIADQNATSPDEYGDDGLFIVTTRNRHFELLHDRQDATACKDDKELCKRYHVFPLRAYIHSGIALSLYDGYPFKDQWDAAQIGFVFCAKSEWKWCERSTKKCVSARKVAEQYVETWNQYLSGDVWGVIVETTPEDKDETGADLDSCWGFYGLDYAREEGKRMAEACAESIEKTDRMLADTFAL